MAKFNKFDVPYQWKDEFTKYPHGYTIFEALCKWTKQVDEMVINQNNWNDYLDNFVENFEFELQEEVQSTITRWQNEGLLDVIIESALNTELDNVKSQLEDTVTDFESHVADSAKHRNIYVSEEPPTIEDGEEGDLFLTPKQIQTGFFTPIVKLGDEVLIPPIPEQHKHIGRYTVIDNICFIAVDIKVNKTPTSTGILTLHGLPFTTASNRPHNAIPINYCEGIMGEGAKLINFPEGRDYGNFRITNGTTGTYRNINDNDLWDPADGSIFARFSGFYFID